MSNEVHVAPERRPQPNLRKLARALLLLAQQKPVLPPEEAKQAGKGQRS